MARRDIEKIIGELGEVRRMLADPHTGVTALHQVQESRHSKVLEHVTYSTTGVREENRELRRRQERMLSDLSQVRAAVDDLRREIAQAWAHTLGLPHIPGTVQPAEEAIEARPAPALETGAGRDDEQKDEIPVPDQHAPDAADDPPPTGTGHSFRDPPEPADQVAANGQAAERPPGDLASVSPAPAGHGEVADSAGVLPSAPPAREDGTEPAPAAAPPSIPAEPGTASSDPPVINEQQAEYRRGLLAAAAVSSARLICHKDTWAFLVEKSLTHAHFRLPDTISDTDDGQIDTHLSGRSLLAVLVTTQHILDQPANDDLAAWALAHAIHTRTHQAVTTTSTERHNGEVTTIVLDDRPPTAD